MNEFELGLRIVTMLAIIFACVKYYMGDWSLGAYTMNQNHNPFPTIKEQA